MSDHLQDKSYSNEYQKKVVEELHRRKKKTAVWASGNSEIEVYLTRGTLSRNDIEPYYIAYVKPLPDSSDFESCVTLRADWEEVDGHNE